MWSVVRSYSPCTRMSILRRLRPTEPRALACVLLHLLWTHPRLYLTPTSYSRYTDPNLFISRNMDVKAATGATGLAATVFQTAESILEIIYTVGSWTLIPARSRCSLAARTYGEPEHSQLAPRVRRIIKRTQRTPRPNQADPQSRAASSVGLPSPHLTAPASQTATLQSDQRILQNFSSKPTAASHVDRP